MICPITDKPCRTNGCGEKCYKRDRLGYNPESQHDTKLFVSRCCKSSNLIEPDWEAAEEAGSLWRTYACYVCKKCGKSCEIDEQ